MLFASYLNGSSMMLGEGIDKISRLRGGFGWPGDTLRVSDGETILDVVASSKASSGAVSHPGYEYVPFG